MNLKYGSIEDTILLPNNITKSQKKIHPHVSLWLKHHGRILIALFFLILIISATTYLFFLDHSSSSSSSTSSSVPDHKNNENNNDSMKDHVFAPPLFFDYIVVGAGPAGIITAVTLAKRLEEESKALQDQGLQGYDSKVLLLESGTLSQSSVLREMDKLNHEDIIIIQNSSNTDDEEDDDDDAILVYDSNLKHLNKFDIPFLWNELSSQTHEVDVRLSSSFYTLHHWPINQTFLGRAIGGSGIHNAMINVRALASDFGRWNISNWTAANIIPYFNLIESYDDYFMNNTSNRGKNGPLRTLYSGSGDFDTDPLAKEFVVSALASGLPLAAAGFNSFNDSARAGVGYYEFNIRNGLRDSVAAGLLGNQHDGVSIPKNLIIMSDATVQKVLFHFSLLQKPRAVGVQYVDNTSSMVFQARLKDNKRGDRHVPEIILSAGAILTPQILSNSGIRDGGDVANLKHVGKNLQDHPVVAIAFEDKDVLVRAVKDYLRNETLMIDMLKSTSRDSAHINEHLGVLGSPGFSAGAFLVSPWSDDGNPDIQLTVFPRTIEPHYTSQIMKNGNPDNMKILITVALLRPEGRHKIKLAPSYEQSDENEFDNFFHFRLPTIEPQDNSKYLTNLDVKRLAWGLEQVRRIQSFSPLSNITGKEIFPGSNVIGFELHEFAKNYAMKNSHWCGSTRMGTDATNSVVDEMLRVHEVESLRIVDAGVMPIIPNANTHSTTCVVAFRAVDLILGVKS